jgi:hypothetical protein
MTRRLVSRCGAYLLGTFGLFLLVLVGKLAPHMTAPRQTHLARLRAWSARTALDGIGAIGWLVDRLPPSVGDPIREAPRPSDRVGARPV